jgi:hypothetical protein
MRRFYIVVMCLVAVGCGGDDDKAAVAGNNGDVPEPEPCDGDCPPEVTLAAPEWVQDEAELTATATDDLGITSVTFLVDGAPVGTATDAPYAVTWDATSADEGLHDVVARATDSGGQSVDAVVQVGVDRTAPRLTIETPMDGDVVGDEIAIEASVDDVSPTRVRCGILGTEHVVQLGPPSYVGSLGIGEVESGEHSLLCTATDAVDLKMQISRTVVVDRPPVVVIVAPESGTVVRARTWVEVTSSDDGEVVSVELYEDDAPVGVVEDGGAWWTPSASTELVRLRAVAVDDRGQMGVHTVELSADIDPCDLDGDGVPGSLEMCEGLDCDDGNADIFPGASDEVGDEIDQSCDGVDGIDSDLDGAASVESGGGDCDDLDAEVYPCAWDPPAICADRQNDARNCGTCLNICSIGLQCIEGGCTCEAEDCQEGTPDDYALEDTPATFFYRIQVVTDGERGEDVDGDGEPDNAFGPLIQTLSQLLGGSINRELTNQIASGELALGAKWPTLTEGVSDQEEMAFDIFTLQDTDENPATQDSFLVRRDSFLPGYQTPRSRFRNGSLVSGRLEAGPSPAFFMEVPLGGIPLAFVIEDAVMRGTLSVDPGGIRVSNATIGGVLPLQSLMDTVNDFLLSEECACIHLDTPLVDLRAGVGRETCVGEPRPNRCVEEGRAECATISSSCRLFMDLMFNEVDIDTDDDGVNDAFSIYLSLSGRGTSIGGLAAE